MSGPGDSPNCLNCGEKLAGQYCGRCGQRAAARLISVWELLRDAAGDLFELDSRLWRTVVPLLIRPGLLTKDYLEGRRARYMPPFRMYLVLSLVFFVIAFFDPRDDLAIFYEPEPETPSGIDSRSGMSQEEVNAKVAEARDEGRRAIEELLENGVIDPDDLPPEFVEQNAEPQSGETANAAEDSGDDGGTNLTVNDDKIVDDCTLRDFELGDAPDWLKRRFTPVRVRNICERLNVAGASGLKDAIVENVPTALFLLLPIMAFVLKLLYPLSRRYYVEHLLFFVHFHAFCFLILTLRILLSKLGSWISMIETVFTLLDVAISIYMPVYLYVAMRRVYGQGRFITFVKYIFLTFSYLAGFTIVMLGAAAIAVVSI